MPRFPILVVVLALSARILLAQPCGEWSDQFGYSSSAFYVKAMVACDHGRGEGPMLYVIGEPGTVVPGYLSVQRWANGRWEWRPTEDERWTILAAWAMTTFDTGKGEHLYLAGNIRDNTTGETYRVAYYDGETWTPVGTEFKMVPIYQIQFLDFGAGPELFVCGRSPGVSPYVPPIQPIVRWTGTEWETFGDWSFAPLTTSVGVTAMCVYDSGNGPQLHVSGGRIRDAQGTILDGVKKWNGESWEQVGTGLYGTAQVLFKYDDGTGSTLYAGGNISRTPGGSPQDRTGVMRLANGAWETVGAGLTGFTIDSSPVWTLFPYDDGSGTKLYAGGAFRNEIGQPANSLPHIARWDGQRWEGVGGGMISPWPNPMPAVFDIRSLVPFDFGAGEVLVAGGWFSFAGGLPMYDMATWDGQRWGTFHSGVSHGPATTLAVHDDGSGASLYVGGNFEKAGDAPHAPRVARWDGERFHPVGKLNREHPPYEVMTLLSADIGSGRRLFVGGRFTLDGAERAHSAAWWNGERWIDMGFWGAIEPDFVQALATYDDGEGPHLFAAATKIGTWRRIYRWTGEFWEVAGEAGYFNDRIHAMAVADFGSGPRLVVAGKFENMSGIPARCIAAYDGNAWSSVGTGFDSGEVRALAAYEHGGQAGLFAGGSFTLAGGAQERLARFDGTDWSSAGVGISGTVRGLHVYDDGRGEALYISGAFTAPTYLVARWDGQTVEPLGTGLLSHSGAITGIAGHDDGAGPSIFFAGHFHEAGGKSSYSIARWTPCPPCYPDCDQSGTLDIDGFICYINRFVAGHTWANCDASTVEPTLNVDDFTCFINAFAQGCR